MYILFDVINIKAFQRTRGMSGLYRGKIYKKILSRISRYILPEYVHKLRNVKNLLRTLTEKRCYTIWVFVGNSTPIYDSAYGRRVILRINKNNGGIRICQYPRYIVVYIDWIYFDTNASDRNKAQLVSNRLRGIDLKDGMMGSMFVTQQMDLMASSDLLSEKEKKMFFPYAHFIKQ